MFRRAEALGRLDDKNREGIVGYIRSLDVWPATLAGHALNRSTALMMRRSPP
jgi:hypothetical protein